MRSLVIILSIFIIIFAVIIVVSLSLKTDKMNLNMLGDISQLIATIIAITGLGFVGRQIQLQREDFSLDKRPYLYVYLKPEFNIASSGQLHGGGSLFFDNRGKIPASNISLDFKVESDKNRPELKSWYIDQYGDFPKVETVFPDQKGTYVYLHPQIGNAARLCYVAALIRYSSTETNKTYWYYYRQLFYVKLDDNNNLTTTLIFTYTNWDRNRENPPSKIEDCDYDKYLKGKAFKSS